MDDSTAVIAEAPRPALPAAPGPAEFAERRLRGNAYLALKNVSCECRDGVLVLRGCLPSYYLKQIAQEAVAQVAGVRGVRNEIEVVAPPRRWD